ncbi:hypothetical protein [Trichococcus collinsii]|uniref:Uncharacterized protein n=1 Tax=Trichococcus collinsii TaxID=157076 RepID=A0AB37ZY69_9LACT|nr:hypothetical protein [Trichococcus collinsii]CZR02782.1 Hypothetical protein Tcol_2079 [Trichococcus collinsii]SDZ96700.1 hypothetical protein SAMN04488525_101743 [Trichococcus collinsii]
MDNNQALSQAHCSYLQEMEQEPVAETWDGEPIYENEEYFDIEGEYVINEIDALRDYLNEHYTLKTAGRG